MASALKNENKRELKYKIYEKVQMSAYAYMHVMLITSMPNYIASEILFMKLDSKIDRAARTSNIISVCSPPLTLTSKGARTTSLFVLFP